MNATAEAAPTMPDRRSRRLPALGWLRARPRLVFGALAVALLLAASTFGRPWLEALGVGSLVLSLLPCAAMCAAGLCMKGNGGCAKQGSDRTGASLEGPSSSTPGNQAPT
uniref:hypothetical protein n=1 Tax=Campylobacter jejuni TaxID=197 RepID=UPI001BFDD893